MCLSALKFLPYPPIKFRQPRGGVAATQKTCRQTLPPPSLLPSSLSNSPAIVVFHAFLRPLSDQGRTSLFRRKSLFWPQNNGSCLFPSPLILTSTLHAGLKVGIRVNEGFTRTNALSSALWPIAPLFVCRFCASVYPVMVHSNHESPWSSVIHNLMPVWFLWQPGDLVPFGPHPIPLRARRTPGFQPKVPCKGSLQC